MEVKKDGDRSYRPIVIWALLIVFILWGASFILLKFEDFEHGTFGDMFGAVNALFSGLAFGGIILTIYMQRDELTLQRKELEETRGVFEKQSNLMYNQQNDTLFFNLLENHRQMVHSFDTKKYKFTGKQNYSYTKELESGYQFISNVSDLWSEYFELYSEMYRTRVLYSLNELKTSPLQLINSNENIKSFIKESVHLADFVELKFGNTIEFDFYKKTLDISFLESEKFILSSWHALQPDLQRLSPFGMEDFDKHGFVDFKNCELPSVRIELIGSEQENKKFIFKSEGNLVNCYSIIEHESDSNGIREIEVCPKNINAKDNSYELTVLDFLKGSTKEISSLPVHKKLFTGLSLRNYYVVYEVLYNNANYYIPILVHLNSKEDLKLIRTVRFEMYNLYFEWHNNLIITKDKAKELIDLIKNKEQ